MDEWAIGFCGSTREDAIQATIFKGYGPGGVLRALLIAAGHEETNNCHCDSTSREMNAWGPQGCRDNLEAIVSVLQSEAESRGVPYWRPGVVAVVRAACAIAEETSTYCTPLAAVEWCLKNSEQLLEWVSDESSLLSLPLTSHFARKRIRDELTAAKARLVQWERTLYLPTTS